MVQTFFILMISFGLLISLNANEVITDQTKLQEIKKKHKVFEDPVLHIKGAIERPHNYIIKMEARSPRGSKLIQAVLDKQSGELYIGSAYEKSGKPIKFPKDTKAIKEGVAFSYGKGEQDIYIVTDPECPYCTKFEKAVHRKLDEDYRVHVILMSLSFHKKAPAMIEWIMQGSDDMQKKERYDEVMMKGSLAYKKLIKNAKKPFVYSTHIEEYIKKSDEATLELNVRGTPSIFNAQFNNIPQGQLVNSVSKRSQK